MVMLVERTYLEMTSPDALRASDAPREDLRIEHAPGCTASFYRYLYAEVGREYRWTDRLAWTDEQIRGHLSSPAISVHVAYLRGTPAGYFELTRHADGSCEISYFGLLPEFQGRGLGRHLLTQATRRAWEGATRVWLHTCTLDGPAALPNYVGRGFQPYRKETYEVDPRASRGDNG
jgi:ribosomal protein S18 acetylase RimI-like enzyme